MHRRDPATSETRRGSTSMWDPSRTLKKQGRDLEALEALNLISQRDLVTLNLVN